MQLYRSINRESLASNGMFYRRWQEQWQGYGRPTEKDIDKGEKRRVYVYQNIEKIDKEEVYYACIYNSRDWKRQVQYYSEKQPENEIDVYKKVLKGIRRIASLDWWAGG